MGIQDVAVTTASLLDSNNLSSRVKAKNDKNLTWRAKSLQKWHVIDVLFVYITKTMWILIDLWRRVAIIRECNMVVLQEDLQLQQTRRSVQFTVFAMLVLRMCSHLLSD